VETFLPLIISWLQAYGYPALWLCIFVAAIGLPLPISLVLLATGTFAALGDFNIVLVALTSISAAVCGDSVGYWLGHILGDPLLPWLKGQKRFRFISAKVIERSQLYFRKRGAWAIFLSRCLVPALGGSINLLAGIERYPYRRFLIYDILGESISTLLPLTAGYVFGASWEAMGDVLSGISLSIFAALVTLYLAILFVRTIRKMNASYQIRKEKKSESKRATTGTSNLTLSVQKGEVNQA
jgi:membrane-associated protein